MYPLLWSDITPEFLHVRPFLLLDVSIFNTQYVGNLIMNGRIKSQAGIALPHELWLKILDYIGIRKPEFCLARPLTATDHEGYTTLTCEVNTSALNSIVTDLKDQSDVNTINAFLTSPDEEYDMSFTNDLHEVLERESHQAQYFKISLAYDGDDRSTSSDDENASNDDYSVSTIQEALGLDCLFHQLDVPNIIAHLQEYHCQLCRGRHTICPGCTGGKAQRFDAFDGCDKDLACPLCLGQGFMYEDKGLWRDYQGKWNRATKKPVTRD